MTVQTVSESREYWLALSNALEGVVTIVGQSKIADSDPRFLALDTALKVLNYTLRAVKMHGLTRQFAQLAETRRKLTTAISILERKEQAIVVSEAPVLQPSLASPADSYRVVRTSRNRRKRSSVVVKTVPMYVLDPPKPVTPDTKWLPVFPSEPTAVPSNGRSSGSCLDRCEIEHDACMKAAKSNPDFNTAMNILDSCLAKYTTCWKRCTGLLSNPQK